LTLYLEQFISLFMIFTNYPELLLSICKFRLRFFHRANPPQELRYASARMVTHILSNPPILLQRRNTLQLGPQYVRLIVRTFSPYMQPPQSDFQLAHQRDNVTTTHCWHQWQFLWQYYFFSYRFANVCSRKSKLYSAILRRSGFWAGSGLHVIQQTSY